MRGCEGQWSVMSGEQDHALALKGATANAVAELTSAKGASPYQPGATPQVTAAKQNET